MYPAEKLSRGFFMSVEKNVKPSPWMREALRLARRGTGTTSPNPMVGAVVVKRGKVIARGWHRKAGDPHAEVIALDRAGDAARGGTLYVTLEPCCHTGRTGPCTERVIRAGVVRVVASMTDPNEAVAGKGFRALRRAGIEVEVGDGKGEAAGMNEAFLKRVRTGLPWIDLKMASTLDGRVADSRGVSQWISGRESRAEVQRLRRKTDAILIGVGTALADNPSLTVRNGKTSRQPARIVLDRNLRIQPSAKLFNDAGGRHGDTIVVCAGDAPARRLNRLETAGAKIMTAGRWKDGHVALRPLLRRLARSGLNRILVEGGGAVAGSFIDAGLVDRFHLFLSPKALGPGIDLLSGLRERRLDQAIPLKIQSAKKRGEDLHITFEREGA